MIGNEALTHCSDTELLEFFRLVLSRDEPTLSAYSLTEIDQLTHEIQRRDAARNITLATKLQHIVME